MTPRPRNSIDAFANVSAHTCLSQMQNVTTAAGYADDSPLSETKLDKDAVPEDCCKLCSANSACVAWTYKEKALLSKPLCYQHSDRELPVENDNKRTCGMTPPPDRKKQLVRLASSASLRRPSPLPMARSCRWPPTG